MHDSLRQSSMEKLTEQSLELSIEDDESLMESNQLQEDNPLQVASGISNQRDEEIVMLRTPDKTDELANDGVEQKSPQKSLATALPTSIHSLPAEIFVDEYRSLGASQSINSSTEKVQ